MKENPDDFLSELPEEEKYEYEQMLVDSAFENSYKVLTKKTTF